MAHKARLHQPVEHQRRVQVPVQAVGTGGGGSSPTSKHKASIASQTLSGMGAGLLNTSRDGTFSLYSNMEGEDGAILALRQVFIPAVLGPVSSKDVRLSGA